MTHLLIDGDILAFAASASKQKTYKWPTGDVVDAHEEEAKAAVEDEIEWLITGLSATDVTICLSDDFANFRNKVWPGYKQNRTGARPEFLYPLKDWLAETYEVDRRATLEADDVMGILSTTPGKERRIIVSDDKDMKTIPGLLFRPREFRKLHPGATKLTPTRVTLEEADRYHLYQTLIGDSTDGYKGCPGVGPVKAMSILDGAEDPWGSVVDAYMGRGLTRTDALVQARLARILRHGEWSEQGGVKLWNPPAD